MTVHTPVPTLTREERLAALEKAAAARHARKELLGDIKAGEMTIFDVLTLADGGSKIAKRMKVYQLLRALPGWGEARTAKWMEVNRISDAKRIGGLGKHQREKLLRIGE